MSKTFTFKEFCQQIIDGANPEDFEITWGLKNEWCAMNSVISIYLRGLATAEFRKIQKTIKVNGWDVPEPLKEKPQHGDKYFCSSFVTHNLVGSFDWTGDRVDNRIFDRRLAHNSKENAIRHSLAMLNRDPEGWKEYADL